MEIFNCIHTVTKIRKMYWRKHHRYDYLYYKYICLFCKKDVLRWMYNDLQFRLINEMIPSKRK